MANRHGKPAGAPLWAIMYIDVVLKPEEGTHQEYSPSHFWRTIDEVISMGIKLE